MKKLLTTILLCGLLGFSAAAMAGNPPPATMTIKYVSTKYDSISWLFYATHVVEIRLYEKIPGGLHHTFYLGCGHPFSTKVPFICSEDQIKIIHVKLLPNNVSINLPPAAANMAKGSTLTLTYHYIFANPDYLTASVK